MWYGADVLLLVPKQSVVRNWTKEDFDRQILQIAGNIELHKAEADDDEELFGEERSTSHQSPGLCLL